MSVKSSVGPGRNSTGFRGTIPSTAMGIRREPSSSGRDSPDVPDSEPSGEEDNIDIDNDAFDRLYTESFRDILVPLRTPSPLGQAPSSPFSSQRRSGSVTRTYAHKRARRNSSRTPRDQSPQPETRGRTRTGTTFRPTNLPSGPSRNSSTARSVSRGRKRNSTPFTRGSTAASRDVSPDLVPPPSAKARSASRGRQRNSARLARGSAVDSRDVSPDPAPARARPASTGRMRKPTPISSNSAVALRSDSPDPVPSYNARSASRGGRRTTALSVGDLAPGPSPSVAQGNSSRNKSISRGTRRMPAASPGPSVAGTRDVPTSTAPKQSSRAQSASRSAKRTPTMLDAEASVIDTVSAPVRLIVGRVPTRSSLSVVDAINQGLRQKASGEAQASTTPSSTLLQSRNVSQPHLSETQTPMKRPRGRPRKNSLPVPVPVPTLGRREGLRSAGLAERDGEVEEVVDIPQADRQEPEMVVKRPRGRPRKHSLPVPAPTQTQSPPKRPRGRPPKNKGKSNAGEMEAAVASVASLGSAPVAISAPLPRGGASSSRTEDPVRRRASGRPPTAYVSVPKPPATSGSADVSAQPRTCLSKDCDMVLPPASEYPYPLCVPCAKQLGARLYQHISNSSVAKASGSGSGPSASGSPDVPSAAFAAEVSATAATSTPAAARGELAATADAEARVRPTAATSTFLGKRKAIINTAEPSGGGWWLDPTSLTWRRAEPQKAPEMSLSTSGPHTSTATSSSSKTLTMVPPSGPSTSATTLVPPSHVLSIQNVQSSDQQRHSLPSPVSREASLGPIDHMDPIHPSFATPIPSHSLLPADIPFQEYQTSTELVNALAERFVTFRNPTRTTAVGASATANTTTAAPVSQPAAPPVRNYIQFKGSYAVVMNPESIIDESFIRRVANEIVWQSKIHIQLDRNHTIVILRGQSASMEMPCLCDADKHGKPATCGGHMKLAITETKSSQVVGIMKGMTVFVELVH